jgi:hypothetical protein
LENAFGKTRNAHVVNRKYGGLMRFNQQFLGFRVSRNIVVITKKAVVILKIVATRLVPSNSLEAPRTEV